MTTALENAKAEYRAFEKRRVARQADNPIAGPDGKPPEREKIGFIEGRRPDRITYEPGRTTYGYNSTPKPTAKKAPSKFAHMSEADKDRMLEAYRSGEIKKGERATVHNGVLIRHHGRDA